MRIGERQIGVGEPCYVVAEMSANHNGSLARALDIVRAAKQAGADALKLQTYTADTLTIDCDNEYFRLGDHALWGGKNLYQLYLEAYTPWEWHSELKAEAERIGIELFSTPFDETAVDFLESHEVPAHKVASFEMIDVPLLEKIGATGKPVIMSTGMATFEEISLAVRTLRENGCKELALLKCTSAYPADPEEMNLRAMPALGEAFGTAFGLSDHTMGSTVAVAAVALGASIVESHFTLCRKDGGADAGFSTEPDEFRKMVEEIRLVEKALGTVSYGPTRAEQPMVNYRRSVFAVRDIASGEVLTPENIRVIRPGHGMPPARYRSLLGRRAATRIARGTPLQANLIAGQEKEETRVSVGESKLVETEHGYYHYTPEPTEEELQKYYTGKYFQQGLGSYSVSYEPDELAYFELKASLIYRKVARLRDMNVANRFIDIGCGEGWALAEFHNQGHHVLGLDFSQHGVAKFHPQVLPFFRQGDVYDLIDGLIAEGEKFDVLLVANVIEHVIDPVQLLRQVRETMAPGAILVILVPNDFSALHKHLLENKFISHEFWLAYPDHLSYFPKEGMCNLLRAERFALRGIVAEHPVDLNLLNENSNYIEDRRKGKKTHLSRCRIDNFLGSQDREKLLDLYEILGQMGVGRDLLYYCSVAS